MSKRRQERLKQKKAHETKRRNSIYAVTLILGLLIIGGLYWISTNGGLDGMVFRDIHGMSYTPDGQLYVATHDGLRVYDNGWSAPNVPANDYMGYSGTQDGFYSSGHPGAGSNLVNPIGLIRSTDYGVTLETIGFAGETDFHVMGAAYSNPNVVYVFNPAQNSRLRAGLHYTLDEGESWQDVTASGITSQPLTIAVHPILENVVAVATGQNGVYLSTDYGETFQSVSSAPTTLVAFATHDEDLLYFGYQSLSTYDLQSQNFQSVNIPLVDNQEALIYFASNPVSGEIAFATSNWTVYVKSSSDGSVWQRIVADGTTL